MQHWLSKFFNDRNLSKPDGRPLYQYELVETDYYDLCRQLKESRSSLFLVTEKCIWAACYCLAVSEFYRREYDGNWSLTTESGLLSKRLPTNFSNNEIQTLVKDGSTYWKRPLIKSNNRTHYVGSLFREGGLPWPLLQNDHHGFGTSIRQGLRKFQENEAFSRPTKNTIKASWARWPKSFQNEETVVLLDNIVQQLMSLVKQHPLKTEEDPATYLDEKQPDWRRTFPLPLDKKNARTLINDWFSTASSEISKRREEKYHFSVTHQLTQDEKQWSLTAIVSFPDEHRITVTDFTGTTRLEWGVFDGHQATLSGGVIYAELDNGELILKLRNQISNEPRIKRSRLDELLNIRVFSNGQLLDQVFVGSEIEAESQPLCFVKRDEDWSLLESLNPRESQMPYRLRLPQAIKITTYNDNATFAFTDDEQGRWYDVRGAVTCQNTSSGEEFDIASNNVLHGDIFLDGKVFLNESLSAPIYLGLPELRLPEHLHWQALTIDGERYSKKATEQLQPVGKMSVVYLGKDELCLLRRRICVLPSDFQLHWEYERDAVILTVKTETAICVRIYGNGVQVKSINDKPYRFRLSSKEGEMGRQLQIEISDENHAPITLHLAYPYYGATAFDENGGVVADRETLLIDQLMGKRMMLASGKKRFAVFLEFRLNAEDKTYRQTVTKHLLGAPIELSLYHFKPIIERLLSLSDSLDASVSLSVMPQQGEGEWLRLHFRRYDSVLKLSDNREFVSCVDTGYGAEDCYTATIRLLNFANLQETEINMRHAGAYPIPEETLKDGLPWLMYPDSNSLKRFRPRIYVNDNTTANITDLASLPLASVSYHPTENPAVFDSTIKEMARDFQHSGWVYLGELKNQFAHLPLSTFEVWKKLVKLPEVLTSSVLRLGLDEAFCLRLSNELAVVWDLIPVRVWGEALKHYKDYLTDLGVVDSVSFNEVIPLSIANQSSELRSYLVKQYRDRTYPAETLKGLLEREYRLLRQRHQDDQWPDDINDTLKGWVRKCQLEQKNWLNVSNNYEYGVLFLPLFIAAVKEEKATVFELHPSEQELMHAYYRIVEFDYIWFNTVCAILTCYLEE